ncbi:hypothetical protein [uncultured Victivallis sp.]|uniref:hypothetical protein n=1 Tax=uncultured Victivallis sp. TaxID=354118 RepID=UPI0025E39BDC|nr:hypothetical protein [uncultured Victivallis sp.]
MDDIWYIEYGNQLYGPCLIVQLQQMLQNNQISLQTMVRSARDGRSYRVQDVVFQNPNPAAPSFAPFPGQAFPPPQPGFVPGTAAASFAPAGGPYPGSAAPPPSNAAGAPGGAFPAGTTHPGSAQAAPLVQPFRPSAQSEAPLVQPFRPSVQESGAGQVPPPVQPPPASSPVGEDRSSPRGEPKPTPPPADNRAEYGAGGLTVTMRDWIDRSNLENGTIVCPHCWGLCSLESILFISAHPELTGDPLLGPDAQARFLPKYFTAKGTAFDARGLECSDMACPHCHLKIPNSVIDLPSSFFSIVGAPASGKSYFLTAMIWQLRKCLPKYFSFSLFDADPSFNIVLNNYERILFLNPDRKDYVSLPKTELRGRDFSNQIVVENNHIDLPKPFVFTLSPQSTHPYYNRRREQLERCIVLYDNAGEHFETGRDSSENLATVHLIHSDGIIFLYDPLKDIRLRQACSGDDPQISRNVVNITNQMTIFTEMIARIHKFGNLKANEKYDKPLIMVIPKFDAWKDSFPLDLDALELVVYDEDMTPYLNMDAICAASFCLRRYLLDIAPEIVGLAEGFSQKVFFIPVSALGRMPEFDEEKSMIGIRPDHLTPIWAEVPFLLQLHFNRLLQAVYYSDDTVPPVEHFQFNRGHIQFTLPECGERFSLPAFYCGKTIYCAETKSFYRLPEYPASEASAPPSSPPPPPSAASVDESSLDLDFWSK